VDEQMAGVPTGLTRPRQHHGGRGRRPGRGA
jgi:hypothetical protein